MNNSRRYSIAPGLASAALGVFTFSLTLPMTRIGMQAYSASTIGAGRGVIAGLFALLTLVVRREILPPRADLLRLWVVGLGVVLGFPCFTSLALRDASASSVAILVALLPLLTAVFATLRAGEKPSWSFWLGAASGSAVVASFVIASGASMRGAAVLWSALAVLTCAVGYAEGGVLARRMMGWRVICWALVLCLPFSSAILIFSGAPLWHQKPWLSTWLALAWVSMGSMFFGFFAWYRGLAMAGVARASQLQLLQPALTLLWCRLLLSEQLTPAMGVSALLVACCVAVCVRARIVVREPTGS